MGSKFLKIKRLTEEVSGVSPSTIKDWRRKGLLIEGVHYFRQSYNLILYNPDLISHYIATRTQPDLHDRKVKEYLASLEPETTKGKRKAA